MQFLEEAYKWMQAGEPFAMVTVVRAEKPTSAKPGAKAIVSDTPRLPRSRVTLLLLPAAT